MGSEFLADVLAAAEQHLGVLFEEERVVDVSIAGTHGTLVDDHGLGLPDLQHGHTGNGALGVLEGGGVDDIVGSQDEHDVHS